jgi:hypothetical protein
MTRHEVAIARTVIHAGPFDDPLTLDQVPLESDCLKLHTHSHRQLIHDRLDRAVADATAEGRTGHA